MSFPTSLLLRAFLPLLCLALSARAQNSTATLGSLAEVSFSQLSERNLAPLGLAALGIRSNEWKHGETAHFVYHFFQGFIATPVSVEAEYYYRVIASDLEKDTSQWERKC